MDIFDEVIAYLKESKGRGDSTLYLTPESRVVLDRWATNGPTDLAAPHTTEVQRPAEKVAVVPMPTPEVVPAASPVSFQPEVVPAASPVSFQPEVVPAASPVSFQPEVVPAVPATAVPSKPQLPKVVSSGNAQADLMFIGEEVWHSDTQQPFSGKSGELLHKMTGAMKLSSAKVYRCSVLKDFSTTFEQAVPCLDVLSRQVQAVQPKVIVIMGVLPLRLLTNTTGRLQNVRGNWLQFEGVPCMPTYHPEFLERCPDKKGDAWNDLQLVMEFLGIAK